MGAQNAAESEQANQKYIKAPELLEPTLSTEDNFFAIYTLEGTKTRAFAAGFGSKNRDLAQGWSDLDLQNGAGTAIEGDARFAVYTDSQMDDPIAYSDTFDLNLLRSRVSSNTTDKALIHGMVPFAGEDRVLALEVTPDAASVGDAVSAANSAYDLGITYSEL